MKKTIYLPSIRSKMGDWIFYSCVMRLADIADRVSFADEIHKNKSLSKLIQRELEDKRAESIKNYLLADKERFFGSLVIAVYGGHPAWSDIDLKEGINSDYKFLDENQGANLGFLSFTGEEKLFALDGQHRLAGIREAVKESVEIGSDCVTTVFVGHKNTISGLQRTRKLFTTLNKNAKAVNKSEIIALDENDAVAVITRRLVEESNYFFGKTISYNKGNSIPKHENSALTNIANLYDVLSIFLGEAIAEKNKNYWRDELRPDDITLDAFFEKSNQLIASFGKNFKELHDYFSEKPENRSAIPYRNENGGSILFRPVGLLIFIEIFSRIYKSTQNIEACIKILAKLPTDISNYPYRDVIWSLSGKKMLNMNKALTRDLLLLKLGMYTGKESTLTHRLQKINPDIELKKYGIK